MNEFKRKSCPSRIGGCRDKGPGEVGAGFAFGLLILALLSASVQAQYTPLNETNDITIIDPYANPMKLMQANGYAHRIYARVGRTPFLLTNSGTFGIWWLRDFNVTTSYWLMATGTVRDATNGLMGFDVGPSQLQLPATSYWSIVRAYRAQAGVTTEIANLSYRLASVTATPEGAAQSLVSPGSWPVNIDVTDLSGAVMSNQMGSGATWSGSQWTFGQDTNAAIVATGAWVRAVNAQDSANTVGAAATNALGISTTNATGLAATTALANTNAVRITGLSNGIPAMVAGLGFSTNGVRWTNSTMRGPGLGTGYLCALNGSGMPYYKALTDYLTAESDPVWTAASNDFRDGLTEIGYNATNGATAYGWGDHAEAGYLTAESGLTNGTTFKAWEYWAVNHEDGSSNLLARYDSAGEDGWYVAGRTDFDGAMEDWDAKLDASVWSNGISTPPALASGTVTINPANGWEQWLHAGGSCTIGVAAATSTSTIERVVLNFTLAAGTVTWGTANGLTLLSGVVTAGVPHTVMFRKPAASTNWYYRIYK